MNAHHGGMNTFTYRRRLPHLRSDGATYFVTWRLHRSQRWRLSCAERLLVASAIQHFEGWRYELWAWVVMDDHVHCVVTPAPEWHLHQVLHSWKSFSAHRLVSRSSRIAPIWQDESFDRLLRDQRGLLAVVDYVWNNPFRRWPDIGRYDWVWKFDK